MISQKKIVFLSTFGLLIQIQSKVKDKKNNVSC